MLWQPISTAPKGGTEILTLSKEDPIHPRYTRWATKAASPERWFHGEGWYWATFVGVIGLVQPTLWQPLPAPPPTDDKSIFLERMEAAVEAGTPVSLEDLARLRSLAHWADAPQPPHWNGVLNKHEGRRAIAEARNKS